MIRQSFLWLVLILILGMTMPLPVHAADADEIARLMQAFEALKAQNEAIAARLSALESQQATGAVPTPAADSDQTDGTAAQERLARRPRIVIPWRAASPSWRTQKPTRTEPSRPCRRTRRCLSGA